MCRFIELRTLHEISRVKWERWDIVIYVAPEAVPAGAIVQCTATSNDASDNVFAAEITVLTSDEETLP